MAMTDHQVELWTQVDAPHSHEERLALRAKQAPARRALTVLSYALVVVLLFLLWANGMPRDGRTN